MLLAYLETFFAVVVWGASFIATKVALQDISPVTVVWLRFSMGVVVLGAAVVWRRQFALPKRNEWLYFALLGFLGITFHQWLQSNGLVTSKASTTAWIVAATPVFMAILGWIALDEKLDWLKSTGIGLAGLGVLLVVANGDLGAVFSGRFGEPGDLLVLISAPNWAIFSVLSRKGLANHPPARMMFYVMALGWLFTSLLFFSGLQVQAGAAWAEIAGLSANGWAAIIFLGVFCSGLAYIAWYDALVVLKSAEVGVFLNIEPLVAVAVAAVVLGEPVGWASLVGGAVILGGVYLVNR